jgi:hypothetical protein
MRGTLSVVAGNVKVDFPETEFEHSRMRYPGVLEHFIELASIGDRIPEETKAKLPTIDEKLEKYKVIKSIF